MKIIFNGREKDIENCETIQEMLKFLSDFVPDKFVIKKNNEIISQDDYETEPLQDGDIVELLSFASEK